MDIVEFAEKICGCKLMNYQKFILEEAYKQKRPLYVFFSRGLGYARAKLRFALLSAKLFGKRSDLMVNCNACFHRNICESQRYVDQDWDHCPSYIDRALVKVHITDAQFKEATERLNLMCEDLLAMRKGLESLEPTIELYHRIMDYKREDCDDD